MQSKHVLFGLVSEAEYADLRGASLRTIRNERCARRGPPFVRLGRRVFYRTNAVQEWLAGREVPGEGKP